MIKKGDNVRFLNDIGGGLVVRVDETNKVVYVEDPDGFEMPMPMRECVVVGAINEKTNFPVKDFSSKSNLTNSQQVAVISHQSSVNSCRSESGSTASSVLSSAQVKQELPIIETPEGETLAVLLAFFPIDIKQLQTTAYECYLVNDSNYFVNYNLVNGENEKWISAANGLIEPNTQELLCEISKDQLSAWERIRVQLLPFKKDKNYTPQAVVDVKIKLNAVKFYKLHSFTTNDYFDELAMIVDVTSEKDNNKLTEISPDEIKAAMFQKEETARPRIVKPKPQAEVIEIDLHINELLDTTAGLSNAAMLQCQLDKFHEVLNENRNRKGQKIVFIHGKGEGILRKEIEKLLKTQYKNLYFQDASFREYGFGATMVTIK